MINLSEFKVDKTILLINIFQTYLSTIASRLEPALLNKIDSIGKCVINYLHTKNISTNKKTFSNYSELYKIVTEDSELSALSENIFKTPEFQSIYDETVAYKDKVQNEWEGSKQNIENIFENHLKIDVPDKAVSVNILHPYCYDGTNNQNNEIYYGHYKGIDNKNYNLVYLMHEYMHCIFPYKSDWNSQQKYLCHSLIELATDNELRVRLGDCSIRYDVGHEELTPQRNRLIPMWNCFLGKTNQSTATNFSNFRFNEFLDYCVEHYNELSVPYVDKQIQLEEDER